MLGQMMTAPLLISSLIDHAATHHGETAIVSVETSGDRIRSSWGEIAANARCLGSALTKLGLEPQARCGTLAWNNRRHLEIYFGVSGAGFVCHTINPRLFPEQLTYIVDHADDRVLFLDASFVPLVARLRADLPRLAHIVLMGSRDEAAAEQIPGLLFYDELLDTGEPGYEWPQFDENTASSLCYTSGTTGNPKGVLYSHRSTLVHTMVANQADVLGLTARDVVLPVVPMFHVNAWGVPYCAAMAGSRLVMPGPNLDGRSLVELIDGNRVTLALGVPTVWLGLLAQARAMGSGLDSLKRTVVGGSACSPAMMKQFREEFGIDTLHAWGMSEMSPLGTVNVPLGKHLDLPPEDRHRLRESQGRPPFGVELKIVDDDGNALPRDGAAQGDLMVRGQWVLDSYFRMADRAILQDGWFATGDVATIDADGYVTIRDRSKDIIKSGGEWISSVELENIAVAHPKLANAAVIGVRHAKWDERPLLVAVAAEGETPTEEELLAHYEDKIARWQIPDKVVFVDELPLNATGKVLKRTLREQFADALTDSVSPLT